MIHDPLPLLLKKYPFNRNLIKDIKIGLKNTGIMLQNGQIGVCANLNTQPSVNLENLITLDLSNPAHRVLAISYLNAHINYDTKNYLNGDIFKIINFKNYNNIVMIGHFRPLAEKFHTASIKLSIFDIKENDPVLIPQENINSYLHRADVVILTSTSIVNNSFPHIIEKSRSDVFLLGPSTILSDLFFQNKSVQNLFGTHFNNYDERILSIIEKGGGTRDFQKYGEKIILSR